MMAREVLGTMPCPECGHPHAEIKHQKGGEKLYRYCPECNVQVFARTERQEAAMRRAITPKEPAAEPAPVAPEATPAAKTEPKKAPSALSFLTGKGR
jgi:predicted  nucleic acid-binding Zn-ribbon protein